MVLLMMQYSSLTKSLLMFTLLCFGPLSVVDAFFMPQKKMAQAFPHAVPRGSVISKVSVDSAMQQAFVDIRTWEAHCFSMFSSFVRSFVRSILDGKRSCKSHSGK